MNVTYLIGNGFDLGIGLQTDFKSFLKYYVGVSSTDEDIVKFKQKIQQDTLDLWADFEKCFGEYIANFNDETIENYIKIYEDVLFELNKYLKIENNRFSDDISKEEKQIIKWITLAEPRELGFRPAVVEDFFSRTGYNSASLDVTYDFLSFNYTDICDRIFKKIKDFTGNVLYSHTIGNVTYTRKTGKLIHVHGELNENMIMGVNDIKQLPFSGNLPNRIKRRIVKPEKNKKIGYKIDEKAARFIKESTIICIYGMSIGETDTIWWERIGSWILTSKEKQLIYFVYDKNVKNETIFGIDQMLDAEEMYCNKLLNALKISKENLDTAKKRIIVIVNSKFMQMNKAKELSNV